MPETGSADVPVIDGYTHVRLLGSGGFSDVHLYQQRFPRRRVAIKVLKVETLDRELRRQFVAEANVMAQLSTHPAIATIHTADISSEGRPYLVMEYCSGGSLGTTYRETPLPLSDVLNIGVRVASALESAHRAGIIHRDVKPANILLTDYGAPVLTDFGISIGEEGLSESTVFRTEYSSTTTMTTGNAGTTQGLSVPWAPAEAFDDVPSSDERSDVYSLAATLFSLLEGRSPFEVVGGNNSALHLSRRIERGEVVAGSRELPESLTSLLTRSLAVSRDARPQSAAEFGMALQDTQRELGETVTPFDIVSVGSDETVEEADLETRVRPRKASGAIPPPPPPPPPPLPAPPTPEAATQRLVRPAADAPTEVRPPAPPAPTATAPAGRRLSGGWVAAIAGIVAGVLVLVTAGIVVGVTLNNSSRSPAAQSSTDPTADADAGDTEDGETRPTGTILVGSYPYDLDPSAFTRDNPAAYADPGLAETFMPGVHFVSQSTNVGCVISGPEDGDLWGCYGAVAWWTWPDQPGDYCYDPDGTVGCTSGIEANGHELPHPRLERDPAFSGIVAVTHGNKSPYTMPILAYGHSLTYGDVTCYAEVDGTTCIDSGTGHGFTIAKDLNTIF
jgi:serine/threonine protein kinase